MLKGAVIPSPSPQGKAADYQDLALGTVSFVLKVDGRRVVMTAGLMQGSSKDCIRLYAFKFPSWIYQLKLKAVAKDCR